LRYSDIELRYSDIELRYSDIELRYSGSRDEASEEEVMAEGDERLLEAGLEEDAKDSMPPMSISIDLEQLRSNWKRRQKQSSNEKDIPRFQAASVKVLTALHVFLDWL
jgi:hypothetical protein